MKLLGLCHINLGEFKEGQGVFETVVKYKDDATSWFYLASCYDNQDDYLHAISAYEEVLRMRSSYVDAYKNLAIVYVKNKEPQKAIDTAKKALEYVQDDYTVYYIAGTACMALRKFDEALEYLEKALELNPEHSQLYNNLGTCYVTVGNLDKAYENFMKASEFDPNNSITYFNIASILQLQNKHKEACEFSEKLMKLNLKIIIWLHLRYLRLNQISWKKLLNITRFYQFIILKSIIINIIWRVVMMPQENIQVRLQFWRNLFCLIQNQFLC